MGGGSGGSQSEAGLKFVAGIVGGLAVVVCGHPIDTIKTRLQVGTYAGDGAAGASSSVLGTLRATVRQEGLRALYKGVGSPLTATPPIYAISFATWGWAQDRAISWGMTVGGDDASDGDDDATPQLTHAGLFLSGAFSGLCQSFVWGPMELVKKRLQVQTAAPGGAAQYSGMIDCARQIVKAEGVGGLYRGFPVVLSFFVPACGVWYGSYDVYRRLLNSDPEAPSTPATLAAGAMAGMSAWGIMFPFDTVAARLQTQVAPGVRSSPGAIMRAIYADGGLAAFYRGLGPCMARGAVADAACFCAYELAMRAMRSLRGKA
ncbi:carnitine/acyl carnitine carrier [Thecamonas trahens ATCC 50062]|uniref:Carnitine/acyl carnitine carrier n=1 Tax=Thecamonas trahens ATCC 50062 TaxID=461836 RepID=A0A0L0D5J2_THETB|nr:carnitine/acyl carnitine carrier [Thecamonas trahens ATCC 50062]KNC47609.1 carnitine/acyl carnitine carrier [Thecamonas trahens ATCC 50062]|eukprot:XP_013759534.1 carnitine/acyl carnitine carrier [Thecamonas trahens ATCC 50062]